MEQADMSLVKKGARRVVIISAVFPPEPVVSAMLSRDIASRLSVDNNVVVLCPHPSRPAGYNFEKIKKETEYSVIHMPSFVCAESNLLGRMRESYSLGKHCVKYLKANKNSIDCIYINSWPLASQYLIIKAAKKLNIPCVLHIQDIYPESMTSKLPAFVSGFFYKLLLPVDKYILKNADVILGISDSMISYLSKTRDIKKSKFTLIRNWQDDEKFLNFIPSQTPESLFTFMYVGSVSHSAGVELLIKSFDKADLHKSKLSIVGNGSEKDECMRLAKELKNENIFFFEVEPANVAEVQSQANVLLLPLRKGISKTATPSKLTAYLFSAKPVIACVEEESDVAKILNDSDCGIVSEPQNAELLTLSMIKLYNANEHQLAEMGVRGREFAITHLSKEKNLYKVVKIIKDFSNGG